MFRSVRRKLFRILCLNQCYCMFQTSTVANSSLFQSTSHLTQTLLKYSVIKIEKRRKFQAIVHSILKRLCASELELLLRALESRGGDLSKCLFVSCGIEWPSDPHVTLFQIFRQPNIESASDLKPLAICSAMDVTKTKVCVNPYHYSRLLHLPENPSPKPLCMAESRAEDESSGIDSHCSDFTRSTVCTSVDSISFETEHLQDLQKSKDSKPSWCCVAYWEHNERVGPLYYESDDVLNVFETLPSLKAKGLCLASLNSKRPLAHSSAYVRLHIGLGLQLSREQDGIWMYNRSNYSLFANGPTLTEWTPSDTNVLVHKVPPGYSLRLVDSTSPSTAHTKSSAPKSVRVSFLKGWGSTLTSTYRRQYVTSCPCWIEIHFFL